MKNIIENKNGLYDLIGLPTTHVLPGDDNTIILIHVDPANTEEQIVAYSKKVREILPNNKILVLPRNVSLSFYPDKLWNNEGAMIAQTLKEAE